MPNSWQSQPEPNAAASELLRRRAARGSLLEFTRYTYRGYQAEPAHALIASTLDKVVTGEITRLMVFAPPQHGKALAVSTPIPTPAGYTAIGDLRVGDTVFADDGRPCKVVAVSPVWTRRPVWEVRDDSGMSVLADSNHLWRVRLDRKGNALTLRTTEFLATRSSLRNPLVLCQGALDLPEADLPVDPYILGVWLGDGSSGQATISKGSEDLAFIRSQIESAGVSTSNRATANTFGILGVQDPLRALGVLKNKHVPPMYLRASARQRLALLQGLIDTDGFVASDGQVEFCSTSQDLALAVRELVFSLGCKVSLICGRSSLYGADYGPKYRVLFYMAEAARLPRKRSRCRDGAKKPNRYLRFQDAGTADTVCIQVDSPSSMFLCGKGMLPTHNSELASVRLPAYWLGRRPEDPVILASYAASLAEAKSRQARQVVESPEYALLFPGTATRRDSRSVSHWELDGHRGSMLAAGVGGPVTGHGALLGIIDDPVENWQEAQSQVVRDTCWEWYRTTFRTRIWERGAIVVIMTRWHEDDLAGRLLRDQPGEWTVLRLPAIAEMQAERDAGDTLLGLPTGQPDPLGRQSGEPLCPARFSLEALEALRRDVGSLGWAGQYQGIPRQPEGNRFKRAWFTIVEGNRFHRCQRVRYWDKAGTEGSGDFSVGVLMARADDGIFYLEDIQRGQWSPAQRDTVMLATARRDALRYGHSAVKIVVEQEPGSGGKESAMSSIRLLVGHSVKVDKVTGSKAVRAEPFASQAEGGNVRIVRGPWNAAFLDEIAAFPNGAHDDQLDAAAGAFNWLGVRRPHPATLTRILPLRTRSRQAIVGLRIVITAREDIPHVCIEDLHCLLISLEDPEASPPPLEHCLPKLLDTLRLQFADLSPEEVQGRWNTPLPNGALPETVLLTRELGKRLWSFVVRRRDPAAGAVIITDHGASDRRAESIALGMAAAMWNPPASVHRAADPETDLVCSTPPNTYLFKMTKDCATLTC
jgi:predicted phage terminase large subunit-like protein